MTCVPSRQDGDMEWWYMFERQRLHQEKGPKIISGNYQYFGGNLDYRSHHGSISFAFLDEDGSCFQRLVRNPPFLFGNRTTKVRKYISRPVLLECSHCHRLGHTTQRCSLPKTRLVCPICGQNHKEEEHTAKCPNVANHIGTACSCPPVCINCNRAKKSHQAKGHRASSPSCPLRSNYRSASPPARASSGGTSASQSAARIDDL